MSSSLSVSNSSSNTAGTTSNPQSSIQSNYQGQPYTLQNSGESSSINNSPRGGNTIVIKNFSVNSIAAEQASSTTTSNNGLSPLAIGLIVAAVVVIAVALYLGNRANKITTKKA